MSRIPLLENIVENVEKVIVDKRYEIELALVTLICEGHILIEDVPGVGKTSLASALAKSLGCSFRRIQFTPDLMPSDVMGFSALNPRTGELEYKRGAVFSNIILADEINRTSPKTQSSLLEAMQERQVTVDGVTRKIKEPFMVLATQNPLDFLGTYPLPEAQMDRFFMRISLGYPGKAEEIRLISEMAGENPLDTLKSVVTAQEIIKTQHILKQVHVAPRVEEYIVDIIRHTRQNPMASLGASPRASISLHKASQAWALYNGRGYVTPDDVIEMAGHVLAHRVIVSQEGKLKDIRQKDIIAEALESVRIPVM